MSNDFEIADCGTPIISQEVISNKITFNSSNMEPLVLSEKGFCYMGEMVKDAGEAYKLFRAWLADAGQAELIEKEK